MTTFQDIVNNLCNSEYLAIMDLTDTDSQQCSICKQPSQKKIEGFSRHSIIYVLCADHMSVHSEELRTLQERLSQAMRHAWEHDQPYGRALCGSSFLIVGTGRGNGRDHLRNPL